MRSNADGTKVVLHEEFVNLFPRDSFPTYRMDDPEFVQIMESEEWNHEPQPYSADYILAASATKHGGIRQKTDTDIEPDRQRILEG